MAKGNGSQIEVTPDLCTKEKALTLWKADASWIAYVKLKASALWQNLNNDSLIFNYVKILNGANSTVVTHISATTWYSDNYISI